MATITKKLTTPTIVVTYILELSEEEAQVLRDIGAFIAGSPTGSRRGLIQNITNELYRAGVKYKYDELCDIAGSLNFKSA